MTKVFHRELTASYPSVTSASGVWIRDTNGKEYIDAVSGAVVCNLGYGDRDVIEAIKKQVDSLAYVHSRCFTTSASEELAKLLVENSPKGFDKVYFLSGGSEAVEAALKLARQYAVVRGQVKKSIIIARENSYHGATLGALGVSGNPGRRALYAPMLKSAEFVSPCYAYRGQFTGETDEQYVDRLVEELRIRIEDLGAENVLAFIAEPVVGASLGAVPALKGYFKRIRKVCDDHNVLLICDEVMCGMGRTGTMFSIEQDNVVPDLIVTAKGLAAGYQPLGAVLVPARIHDAILDGPGFFQHGHTYVGHATACAAGAAVIKKIIKEKLLDRVQVSGRYLQSLLQQKFADHPYVGDIRGRGLLLGMEFVMDKVSKKPFEPSIGLSRNIDLATKEAGVLCYPVSGFIDGVFGDHILIAPSFTSTEQELEVMVDRLHTGIQSAMSHTGI